MVPKRTPWAVDRHTLDTPVYNKSGDLYYQGIIKESNLGIGSHVSITFDANVFFWDGGGEERGREEGGRGTLQDRYKLPHPPLTPLFCYRSLLDSLNMKHLFC